MDQNIHGMRHSFWNLNREIIEDIRELMVTRKRASQRMGRLDRSAVDGVELANNYNMEWSWYLYICILMIVCVYAVVVSPHCSCFNVLLRQSSWLAHI